VNVQSSATLAGRRTETNDVINGDISRREELLSQSPQPQSLKSLYARFPLGSIGVQL